MKILQYCLFVFLLLPLTEIHAQQTSPVDLIKNTIEHVRTAVEQDKDIQHGDRAKILALIEAKILPHFDFPRMIRLTLGRYWRQTTPEQRATLEKEFCTLLVRTYTSAISPETYSKYKEFSVTYKPLHMDPGSAEATVRTEIRRPGEQPIPIDYDMVKSEEGWKIYDVAVDRVSLVINYRHSFAAEIRKRGIEGLIRVLAEKNRAAGETPPTPQQKNSLSRSRPRSPPRLVAGAGARAHRAMAPLDFAPERVAVQGAVAGLPRSYR